MSAVTQIAAVHSRLRQQRVHGWREIGHRLRRRSRNILSRSVRQPISISPAAS